MIIEEQNLMQIQEQKLSQNNSQSKHQSLDLTPVHDSSVKTDVSNQYQDNMKQHNSKGNGTMTQKVEIKQQNSMKNEALNHEVRIQPEKKTKVQKSTGRPQKFKRSTNNSHKKFISVARKWMFKNYRNQLKYSFENKFNALKSTRTYFFIILAFVKYAIKNDKHQEFKDYFTKEILSKIETYTKQIEETTNQNLKNFRKDEIMDLNFAIRAFNFYFQGDIEKALESIYKKDKSNIVKKQHYQEALKAVKQAQQEFSNQALVQQMITKYNTKKGKPKSKSNHSCEEKSLHLDSEDDDSEKSIDQKQKAFKPELQYQRYSPKNLPKIVYDKPTRQCNEDEEMAENAGQQSVFCGINIKEPSSFPMFPEILPSLNWFTLIRDDAQVGFRRYVPQ